MPRTTREAMLDGITSNKIIVGAYTDRDGGICPMLAAHRHGGRTALASFARAWDRYTDAHGRPRPATDRELRTLKAMLEASLYGRRLAADLTAAVSELKAAKERRARERAVARHREGRHRRARPHAGAQEAPRLGLAAGVPPLRRLQGRARPARGGRARRARRAPDRERELAYV